MEAEAEAGQLPGLPLQSELEMFGEKRAAKEGEGREGKRAMGHGDKGCV